MIVFDGASWLAHEKRTITLMEEERVEILNGLSDTLEPKANWQRDREDWLHPAPPKITQRPECRHAALRLAP